MKNTSRLMDILDRCVQGPVVSETKFDLEHVSQGIQQAIKKYDIRMDQSHIVNQDDELADRVWQAAIDFFESCGVYCTSTGRVIAFSREEIERIVRQSPAEAWIGEGTDARLEYHREVEDPRPPLVVGGPIGAPLPEDLFVPIMQSYVQEPIVDATTGGFLETVYGREIRARSPLEVIAAWEEMDLMMLALKRAGRPGMSVGCVQMSVSDIGHLSAVSRGGYRPTDFQMIAMIGEMKTNFELLNKVAHCIRQDGVLQGFYNPIYGGLCGGAEGLAVLITAGMIALNVTYMATSHGTTPTHPFHFNDTGRETMMAASLAFQAISRNSHLITVLSNTPVGGPGTKTLLYETAALTTLSTVSGSSHAFGPRSATGVVSGHCTGLEARFTGEVAHAATKVNREQADEIVKKALNLYEDLQDKKPFGKSFPEVYDVNKVQPKKDWLNIYDQVKKEVASWGLPLQ